MAVTEQKSDQLAGLDEQPFALINPDASSGKLRLAFFEFTQATDAGDAGSLAYLCKLPAGNVRLILPLSRVAYDAMGSSRTMDLGWLAYTGRDGSAVGADPNGLDDGVNVASAGSVTPGGTIGTHETVLFQSKDGVTLTAQINDGTLAAGKKISGYFVYVKD